MSFQSAQKRQFWLGILLGFGVDVVIAGGIAWEFTTPGYSWLWPALIIFLVIEAFAIAWSIRVGIGTGIALLIFGTRTQEDALLATLRQADLPPPLAYELSPESYLTGVADNPENTVQQRLTAAGLVGALQGVAAARGIIANAVAGMAWERALTRYREEKLGTK